MLLSENLTSTSRRGNPIGMPGREMGPFLLDDLPALREKLTRAGRDQTTMGRMWDSVRRRAQAAPEHFPWFTPLVAMVTQRPQDVENARNAIRRYVTTLDPQTFGMGVQFHFWCFAFPHLRRSLYFQWLQSIGAWEPAEEQRLGRELLIFQYLNFFYGLRVKPEPECVDNQTLSLALSNALIGHLFSGSPFHSAMAQQMEKAGIRRLPDLLGGLPASGYSGEGSTYMDQVLAPAMPFVVELLERVEGGEWFSRRPRPGGGSAQAVAQMIARQWMPDGLLLPWDHYGYELPTRACLAYAARRTGDAMYRDLLEKHADLAFDANAGWGFDDPVWTLVWWPPGGHGQTGRSPECWMEPEIGGSVVADDASLYLMQMWDKSEPGNPVRCHVNPNAVVLHAFGSPLTVDGIPAAECTAFNYDDTWREVGYMDFKSRRSNFGSGGGGAHGVLLVDGWEGMRAQDEYAQIEAVEFDPAVKMVGAQVTPVYHRRWPDIRRVSRRSRLCRQRFWLIEDLFLSDQEHEVTARWFLRPELIDSTQGVAMETAEGVRLYLMPLLGPDEKSTRRLVGYPDRLDGASIQVDFRQRGRECRWLWLAWPQAMRREAQDVADGWSVIADERCKLTLEEARGRLASETLVVPFTMPAYMVADMPVAGRWWYRREISAPEAEHWWLRLPRNLRNLRIWVDGVECPISDQQRLRMKLVYPHIPMPARPVGGRLSTREVIVRCDTAVSQYFHKDLPVPDDGPFATGGVGFFGRPAVLVPEAAVPRPEARYENGIVTVRSEERQWRVEHTLIQA